MLSSPRRLFFNSIQNVKIVHMSTAPRFDPRSDDLKKRIVPQVSNKPASRYATDVMKFLQTPFDFSTPSLQAWWNKRRFKFEIGLQSPKSLSVTAGTDLAAGYTLLPLGAKVLYRGKPWMEDANIKELPTSDEDAWVLEAIDVSNCAIHYEGLLCLSKSNNVHTFIAKKCPYIDDWCLDRISSALLGLENLDLAECENVSFRGLVALIRLTNLKTLDVTGCPGLQSDAAVYTFKLLKEYNPNLVISGILNNDEW